MVNVSGLANETLVALGTDEAVAELSLRGNTVLEGGRLEKTVRGSELLNYPTIKDDDVVTIVDGAVVAVNGNPYP